MPTWLLFLGPTLIWASTWHVILYQLGQVPVLNSVGWRFALAAVVLALLTRWQGLSLRLPKSAHGLMLAAGIVQYSGNYWAVYEAERYIPSGLVAVLFALMVFGNALGAWWAFGQKSSRGFLLAALGGTVGVVGGCRALGMPRAGLPGPARLDAGEACGGPPQRAGNDAWPALAASPKGSSGKGANALLAALARRPVWLRPAA